MKEHHLDNGKIGQGTFHRATGKNFFDHKFCKSKAKDCCVLEAHETACLKNWCTDTL